MAVIYTDGHMNGLNGVGGFFPNSGYSMVKTDKETFTIPYEKKRLTNNEAELLAIFHAITKAYPNDTICSDSRIAIRKATMGNDLLSVVVKYIIDRKKLILKWIPREKNPVT